MSARPVATIVDEWVIQPAQPRSRLAVQLREPEDGTRFLSIVREIRSRTDLEWFVRRALSIHPHELQGLRDLLNDLGDEL